MNNGDSLEEETNDIFDNEWNKASNEAEKERIEKERNEVLSIRPRESNRYHTKQREKIPRKD